MTNKTVKPELTFEIFEEEFPFSKNCFEKWYSFKDKVAGYNITRCRPFRVQKVLNNYFHLN